MATQPDPGIVSRLLRDIVHSEHAAALVAAYFDLNRGFAGALFDGLDPSGLLANNPSDHFMADDIAAASLLDVRYGPTAVREVLGSGEIREALAAVPVDLRLWNATPAALEVASRYGSWSAGSTALAAPAPASSWHANAPT